jgi:hypothetical protein
LKVENKFYRRTKNVIKHYYMCPVIIGPIQTSGPLWPLFSHSLISMTCEFLIHSQLQLCTLNQPQLYCCQGFFITAQLSTSCNARIMSSALNDKVNFQVSCIILHSSHFRASHQTSSALIQQTVSGLQVGGEIFWCLQQT